MAPVSKEPRRLERWLGGEERILNAANPEDWSWVPSNCISCFPAPCNSSSDDPKPPLSEGTWGTNSEIEERNLKKEANASNTGPLHTPEKTAFLQAKKFLEERKAAVA